MNVTPGNCVDTGPVKLSKSIEVRFVTSACQVASSVKVDTAACRGGLPAEDNDGKAKGQGNDTHEFLRLTLLKKFQTHDEASPVKGIDAEKFLWPHNSDSPFMSYPCKSALVD